MFKQLSKQRYEVVDKFYIQNFILKIIEKNKDDFDKLLEMKVI